MLPFHREGWCLSERFCTAPIFDSGPLYSQPSTGGEYVYSPVALPGWISSNCVSGIKRELDIATLVAAVGGRLVWRCVEEKGIYCHERDGGGLFGGEGELEGSPCLTKRRGTTRLPVSCWLCRTASCHGISGFVWLTIPPTSSASSEGLEWCTKSRANAVHWKFIVGG